MKASKSRSPKKDFKKEDRLYIQSVAISGVTFWVKLNNEWNWTWHNIWNLLFINLKDKSYSTVLGESFRIYSVYITEK